MRLVPVECLKNNSVLAKNIYNYDGKILIKSGIALTDSLINKLRSLHISSAYIIDEYSLYEVEDIIKPELICKSIHTIKEVFSDIERVCIRYDNNKLTISEIDDKQLEYFNSINQIAQNIINSIANNNNVIFSLVDLKNMDIYTYSHSLNVAIISLTLGIALNMNEQDLTSLCIGALVHDIGKAFIPKSILLKPGKLTKKEFETVKKHSELGYEFLRDNPYFNISSKKIVLEHHEHYDGNGYPYKKSGKDISRFARIVCIADVYDALTSNRAYKRALIPTDSLEYLMSNSGTLFDPELLTIFCRIAIPFPHGTIVDLSNGDMAQVEKTLPNYPLRPIVKIIKSNEKGNIGKTLDLINNPSIVIANMK